ncbi:MAG: hypothetical protein KBA72_12295 [Thermoanaerobaculia bacterium]|jgi:hypothetical protein|nr:hypothetical protein [Thermoanaerobaculia bacterium]
MKKLTLAVALLLSFALAGSASAANSLAVTAGAALNGTNFGLAVSTDGSANNVFVQSDHPTDETHYLIRFWLNPSTVSIDPNTSIRIGAIGDDGAAGQHVVFFLRHDVPVAGTPQYTVNAWRKDDAGTFVFANNLFHTFVSGAAARQYEFEWTRSTGVNTNDGSFRMTRLNPTVVTKTNSNLDNDTLQADNIRIGILSGSGVNGNSGSFFFDEFESYR